MALINNNGARQVNAFIRLQEETFSNWTQDDVFGLAIEFRTLNEVQDYFKTLMGGNSGFDMLLLVDRHGKVLSAVDRQEKPRTELFKGSSMDFVAGLENGPDRAAMYVKRPDFIQSSLPFPHTYLFRFKTRDSEGKSNGFFLAYVNWSMVQAKTAATMDEYLANGIQQAEVIVVDNTVETALAHSRPQQVGRQIDNHSALEAYLHSPAVEEAGPFVWQTAASIQPSPI
ncbi:hypothetical protein [Desulfosarcina ovata]|nr:hypothetical protein [Desulfosarcina ovata]